MNLRIIDNYILVIEDALDPAVCDVIIKRYEADAARHVERVTKINERHFFELNVSNNQQWNDVHRLLVGKAYDFCELYRKTFHIKPFMWPEPYTFEQLRIKRYKADGVDGFGDHVDAGDIETTHRFLTYFWYLNDVEEGGETVFTRHQDGEEGLAIKPKQGSMLIFPPVWTYPHLAKKPISGPKYIVGGHLHHVIPNGAALKSVNGIPTWC